jgi:hypothetical protein
MGIHDSKRIITRLHQMQKHLRRRRIQFGKQLRRLQQAFLTGEILDEQKRHDRGEKRK